MKKLLLIAAASATVLSSTISFADNIGNEWYLRMDVGATVFNKEKEKITGLRLKPSTPFSGNLGIGYYVTENFRTDLTLGAIVGRKLKKSGAFTSAKFSRTNGLVSHKPTITRLLINGYVDLSNFDVFDIFVGGGVGAALVKEKVGYKGTVIDNGNQVALDSLSSVTKNRTNISYRLTLGASAKITDGVKAEVAYSWIDDGKARGKVVPFLGTNVQVGGMRYQSHNLTAGLRFDM